METYSQRLSKLIKDHADGKHTVFAKKVGIPTGTFQSYVDGKLPKSEYLLLISEKFNVSIDWLLTGIGDPYIKEEDSLAYSSNYEEVNLDENPEMIEVLALTREILQSGTGYSDCLVANIRSFHNSVMTEKRLNKIEGEIAELKNMCSRPPEGTERQLTEKEDKIREADPPEKKEEFINMRATSTG